MYYPNDFKKEVKRLLPEETTLHKLLDEGNVKEVGRFFERKTSPISANDILSAKSLGELQERAREFLIAEKLYEEWTKISLPFTKK